MFLLIKNDMAELMLKFFKDILQLTLIINQGLVDLLIEIIGLFFIFPVLFKNRRDALCRIDRPDAHGRFAVKVIGNHRSKFSLMFLFIGRDLLEPGDYRLGIQSGNALGMGKILNSCGMFQGERPIHQALEQGIAGHIGVEDAIVFVSGHATNVTTIGHLFDRNDVILHDSLCHDSIMQGIYLSGAKRLPFPHGDSAELERLLNQIRSQHRRALICTEGLFSMDGDICDLPALIDIKKKYQCNLIIDEAHSMGILGPCGRGIAHHYPGINPEDVDLWMGTLSKSFASCGGYIAGKKPLIRYLKYTAPGFLYSVGMPAPNAAAALKSLELMQRHPEIVEQLRMRSKLFLELARANGINTGAAIGAAVVPAIIGNSIKCMRISQALAEQKINVQPIVYPAVEENASRLRFFISATHSEQEIRFTVDALSAEIKKVAQ